MLLSPVELRDAHAALGTVESLLRRRRATYSAALELATGSLDAAGDSHDLLDSPAVRAHLADVICGTANYTPSKMIPVSSLARGAPEYRRGDVHAYVAADEGTPTALDGAFRRLTRGLRHSDDAEPLRLLLAGAPAFDRAARLVVQGLALAVDLCPVLASDLLPHVTMFAIIEAGDNKIGSASLREYPGLIVVPQPSAAIEVAEAFIHEGAHQKFFDLGITHSIFNEAAYAAPYFATSWAAADTPPWPFEQCVAAFHAYICLATFMRALEVNSFSGHLHEFSLLPYAKSRAAELGEWLVENKQYFGPDGRHLVELMTGTGSRDSPPAPSDFPLRPGPPTALRDCGEWTLVAQKEEAIELYWLPSADLSSGFAPPAEV
jgi:hypothetical protein